MRKLTTECPLERSAEIISGKWKICILTKLSKRTYRFKEIKRAMGDITVKMLSQQLKELVKVENEPNLKKDTFNGAVLNFDSQGLLAYKNLKKSQENINSHVDEINKIKDDISEIKGLLKTIIKEVK